MASSMMHGHRAAVIGHPIAHSLSPFLHGVAYREFGLDWEYTAIDVPEGGLPDFLATLDDEWVGLSVTMPHKIAALTCADMADSQTKLVGVANTLTFAPVGRQRILVATNTDVAGIVHAVRAVPGAAEKVAGGRALVLGGRATASSTLAALITLKARHVAVAARSFAGPGSALPAAHRMNLDVETSAFENLTEKVARADVVISTVPAGVADELASTIGDDAALRATIPGTALLDIVYAPYPSPLVAAWREAGGIVVPGWSMLIHQAVEQIRLFTGRDIPAQVLTEALLEERPELRG